MPKTPHKNTYGRTKLIATLNELLSLIDIVPLSNIVGIASGGWPQEISSTLGETSNTSSISYKPT